jgi:hypothetical protein
MLETITPQGTNPSIAVSNRISRHPLRAADARAAVLLRAIDAEPDAFASLEKMARFCLKSRHRAADFPRLAPSVDFPAGHGASTLWMLVR